MGCLESKPGRTDIPLLGMAHDFDARPVGDKIIVSDGLQNKWFEIDTNKHLRHREEVTSEHYQLWKTEGKAHMHGPLGVEEKNRKELECEEYDFMKTEAPLMTIHIGPCGFKAIDDEETTCVDIWEAWWEGKEYEEMAWALTRGLEVKTSKGKEVAEIRVTIVGTARCWKMADGEWSRHAKYHKVTHQVSMNGKPMKVVEHERTNRYSAKFEILPDDHNVSMEVNGCTVETRMEHNKHCVVVRTADQCPPLGGLCVGVGMSAWMHPLTAEKHAGHFAFEHMREKFGW